MKKARVPFILIFCVGILFSQTPVPPSLGDGSISDPFQIETADNLNWLARTDSVWSLHFIQTADIDINDIRSQFPDFNFSPIGHYDYNSFTGSYNGQGHIIDNLFIDIGSNAGLFGYAYGATITNVGIKNAQVISTGNAGCLVCSAYQSFIANCFSEGSVTGSYMLGGLISDAAYSVIYNCYNKASVNQIGNVNSYIGGFGGRIAYWSTIVNCYNIGKVNTDIESAGGFVGYTYETETHNCFWNIETSGLTVSAAGTGKTTFEMQQRSTYFDWDFNTIWGMHFFNKYPYLQWENPKPEGNGTEMDPYQIDRFENFIWMREDDGRLNAHYKQIANINMSEAKDWFNGIGWLPFTMFTGSYDGNGHSIDSLYINWDWDSFPRTYSAGFFDILGSGAIVKDLAVTNVDITTFANAGALAGINMESTIENCYSSGIITSIPVGSFPNTTGGCVGGLAGINGGTLRNCYSEVNVHGHYNIGGLIGQNNFTPIDNCYSFGAVSGDSTVGGLIGYNHSSAQHCFWDIESSGIDSSAGSTGKTTAEMKTLSTFTNAGWDFAYETVNGTDDIWKMDPNGIHNGGYPYFNWSHGLGGGNVDIDPISQPKLYSLEQNYPNPFNPVTTIGFHLPEDHHVELTIFDMSGRKIETLINRSVSAGNHEVKWNAGKVASGVYLYCLNAGDFIDIKKMLIVK